jgi:hypothetical protein
MSDINGFILGEQQQNIYSVVNGDTLSFIIWNMSEFNLSNATYIYQNDSTNHSSNVSELTSLTYTIFFGLICACLCFLTVTGNLLVLVTFRRMRTVSIIEISIEWLINGTVYQYVLEYG